MRNRLTCVLLFTKCVLFILIQAQLNDQCQVARSGTTGVCRHYEDCPVVLNELIEHGLMPTKCGYQDRKEIICCPLPPTQKPTSSPLQSNRISAKSKQNAQFVTTHKWMYTQQQKWHCDLLLIVVTTNNTFLFLSFFVFVLLYWNINRMCWVSRCGERACAYRTSRNQWKTNRAESVSLFHFYRAVNCWRWADETERIPAHGNNTNDSIKTTTSKINTSSWLMNGIYLYRHWLDLRDPTTKALHGDVAEVWFPIDLCLLPHIVCTLWLCEYCMFSCFELKINFKTLTKMLISLAQLVDQLRTYYWAIWIIDPTLMMHNRANSPSLNASSIQTISNHRNTMISHWWKSTNPFRLVITFDRPVCRKPNRLNPAMLLHRVGAK